jgi:competence protein ComEC
MGRPRRSLAPVVALTLMVAAAGWLVGAGRVAAMTSGPLDEAARQEDLVTLRLRLTADPLPRSLAPGAPSWQREQVRVTAQALRAAGVGGARPPPTQLDTPVVVLAPSSWAGLGPGTVLQAVGRLRLPSRAGPVAAIVLVSDEPRVLGRVPSLLAWADPPRRALRAAVAGLPADPAGLLPSLVVGDETLLAAGVRENLRRTGLAHLTAVSGANVAIALGAVLTLARWSGVRRWALPVLGLVTIVGFALVARPDPSVVRASAMGVVVVLGLLAGGRRGGIGPLALAVLVLLLIDPWLARSMGFALSCAATAGIVLLARPWARAGGRWMPLPVGAALSVPLAAQLACTPLLVAMTGELSMSAIPANVLAAPAVPVATVLGLACAGTGLLAPPLAHLLALVAMVPTGWIVLVADRFADLPGTVLPWTWGAAAAGLLAVLVVGAVPTVLRSPVLSAATCLVLGVLLLRPGFLSGWPPPGWVLVACDVGQGDAVVLRAGAGQGVVVDTGPDPTALDRCLDDLDVVSVPVAVISHFHSDHVAGITGVAEDRTVGSVLVAPYEEPSEQAAELRRWARATGVPVTVGRAGQRTHVGDVSWTVLGPTRIIRSVGSTPNQASLVLRAEVSGVSVLLTGDIEPAAQQALGFGPNVDVDVLKVPHHGSPDQDRSFLVATSPLVAIVSVGAENTYGHPGEDTIETLQMLGAQVLRTDVDGDIAVAVELDEPGASRLSVVRRRRAAGGRSPPAAVACSGAWLPRSHHRRR